MSRRFLPLCLLAAAVACDASPTTSGPDLEIAPQHDLSDGSNGGNSNAFFLPPLVENPTLPSDVAFNPSLSPTVEVRCVSAAGGCPAPIRLTSEIAVKDGKYAVNWDTSVLGRTTDGDKWRIVILLPDPTSSGEVDVAFADVWFASNGSGLKNAESGFVGLKDGRTVPIQFWLGDFVLGEAVQSACESEGAVIDCDVVSVPLGGPSPPPLVVFQDPNTPSPGVGQLSPPGNSTAYDPDCVEASGFVDACRRAFTVVFEHVEGNPAENANQPIPDENAFGFFVRVDAFDTSGGQVIFNPADGGWSLDLCQDAAAEGLGPFVVAALSVFQVKDDGDVVFPPFTNGTGGFCSDAGNGVAFAPAHRGSLLGQLRARWQRLAALASPRSLFASSAVVTHGGKRTTDLIDFSGFGTTLTDLEPAPFGYGQVFGYEGTEGQTGLGVSPFYTGGGTAGCPLLNSTIPNGAGTAGVWTLGDTDTPLTLSKRFTTNAATLWLGIAVDNDVAIRVNGTEIPLDLPSGFPGANVKASNGFSGASYQLGGTGLTYWEHENCATLNSLVVELSAELVAGENLLEIFAIDRGSVGYLDAAIFDSNPVP